MRLKKLQIGIDIQENVILFVINDHKWRRKKIRTIKIRLPISILSGGQLIHPDLFKKYLKRFHQRLSTRCEYAITLETNQTFTQQLSLPIGVSLKDYATLIPATIQQCFPLPIEELAFDFIVGHEKLIITAAHKKTIEQWQTLFNQLGLSLICISVKPIITNNLQLDPFYYARHVIACKKSQFNLLPWRQLKKRQRQYYLLILSTLSIIVMVLMFYLIWRDNMHKLQQATQLLSQLTQQTQLKQQQINVIQQIKQQIQTLTIKQRQQQQYLQSIHQLRLRLIDIANLLPNGVWLTQLTFTSTLFDLTGKSLTYLQAAYYIERLCQLPSTTTCQLKYLQQKNPNEFIFAFKLEFKSLNEATDE